MNPIVGLPLSSLLYSTSLKLYISVSVIGNNCIIGANSLITEGKIIPDNSLVMGSPGKVIRQVTEEEKKAITENAQRYIDNWKKYVKDLKKI